MPIAPDRGAPRRGVTGQIPVAGYKPPYFWKGGQWLPGLEFTAENRPGVWEQAGDYNTADVWLEPRYAAGS